MMNKLYTIGNLTADPEMREFNGVTCATFTVASTTRQKDSEGNYISNFYRVTAWRGLAETCMKFLHKGNKVAVMGDLLLQTYNAKDGTPRSSMQLTATDIEFLTPKTEQNSNAPAPAVRNTAPAPAPTYNTTAAEDDDDLPF